MYLRYNYSKVQAETHGFAKWSWRTWWFADYVTRLKLLTVFWRESLISPRRANTLTYRLHQQLRLEYAFRRGAYYLLEQPATSVMFNFKPLKRILKRHNAEFVAASSAACFAVSNISLAPMLQLQCRCVRQVLFHTKYLHMGAKQYGGHSVKPTFIVGTAPWIKQLASTCDEDRRTYTLKQTFGKP